MKIYVYSIYDIKAEEYGPLFLAKNNDVAIRMIKNTIKDFIYPQDYDLYCVGNFDSESGELYGILGLVCNLVSIFEPVEDSSEYVPVLDGSKESK